MGKKDPDCIRRLWILHDDHNSFYERTAYENPELHESNQHTYKPIILRVLGLKVTVHGQQVQAAVEYLLLLLLLLLLMLLSIQACSSRESVKSETKADASQSMRLGPSYDGENIFSLAG